MIGLAPFWRYYGGKNRAARHYPAPEHGTIVEPFAGAAGYACNYPDRRVVLYDQSPIIAGIWRYLISVTPAEILQIPDVPDGGTIDDLPPWVPQEARWLAGFWCSTGVATPRRRPSTWTTSVVDGVIKWGWCSRSRLRIASQLPKIRHWEIIEASYEEAALVDATWFVDPPYQNRAGSHYPYQPRDFASLGRWCQSLPGFVIVCENTGADWLPFRALRTVKSGVGHHRSSYTSEAIWTNRRPLLAAGGQAVFPWGAA